MSNFFKHLNLITKHRFLILHYSCKVGIFFQGLTHDLSKYSPTEFNNSVKYYQGNESPILKERRENDMYSEIFTHHTGRNKHHFEYHVDFFKEFILIKYMPFKYTLESIIDMISASKVYQKKNFKREYVLNYFETRKDLYLMHPGTKEFITFTLNEYKENGFKNLKKKYLLPKYEEILKKYNNVYKIKIDMSSLKEKE